MAKPVKQNQKLQNMPKEMLFKWNFLEPDFSFGTTLMLVK